MNRCPTTAPEPRTRLPAVARHWRTVLCTGCALAALAWAPLAAAQLSSAEVDFTEVASNFTGRNFPATAYRGTLVVQQTPEVVFDGKADRLSPGSRIRDPQNRIVSPSHIAGMSLVVNYQRNASGELHDVWILSPLEASQKRATFAQTQAELAKRNKGQAVDDGKTPFDQLPRWKQPGE